MADATSLAGEHDDCGGDAMTTEERCEALRLAVELLVATKPTNEAYPVVLEAAEFLRELGCDNDA